ncbi:MAG: fatty acid desaturase [Microcoleus vaginatus WJT46-NPBG5]|jgi:beta-carotene ketolase (CrtW type)|nr:fatty acid desaturase [Microcoleus vaginatus WJT46-NPBG5]
MIQLDRASLPPVEISANAKTEEGSKGILIAFAMIALWASSLVFLVCLDLSKVPVWLVLPAILWQTFLYTGLFILSHDAMHGAVFPQNRKINNFIGSAAVFVYALFSYKKLLKKHGLHHQHPATELDPDFHDLKHKNFFAWYFHFMRGYTGWMQIIGLMVIFNIVKSVTHIPEINLELFWGLPSLLSSLQLFYFGTFLPHREPKGGYTNSHRAKSSEFPVFWSFVTCYHFGYHQQHHENPNVPWWKLPEIYKNSKQQPAS